MYIVLRVWFWILDYWVGMDSGDETSEYGTVRTPVGCRSVKLPTSPDYARNVSIMLESVPNPFCSYYARNFQGPIMPDIMPA